MVCYIHPERDAIGTCASCQNPICQECAVETQGQLICKTCLANRPINIPNYVPNSTYKDPNTAFLIELVGGIFGLLGLGYLYTGRSNDGVLRLLLWIVYNTIAYITITLLLSIIIGIFCIPIQLVLQIGVPLWSANALKKKMMES